MHPVCPHRKSIFSARPPDEEQLAGGSQQTPSGAAAEQAGSPGASNGHDGSRADIALPSDVVYPRDPTAANVGVGPAPRPWPEDPRLDPRLLAEGDRRNVLDCYRYWTVEAIVADLDTRRHPLHIAIQNWEHDFNIGSIVRTGNAFNVAGVHILGRHRWNRRGALVTDRYLDVHHHRDVASFVSFCQREGLGIVGVDNLPGSVPLESVVLPERCCLVFGSEGSGLTDELVAACGQLVSITQYGSTRSMNAGAAAAIAMYHWALSHAAGPADGGVSSPLGPSAPAGPMGMPR